MITIGSVVDEVLQIGGGIVAIYFSVKINKKGGDKNRVKILKYCGIGILFLSVVRILMMLTK